jgi:hypothetical protein
LRRRAFQGAVGGWEMTRSKDPMKDIETYTNLIRFGHEDILKNLERLAEYAERLRKACDEAAAEYRH